MLKICKIDGCGAKHFSKGYCKKHYASIVWSKKARENRKKNREICCVLGCKKPIQQKHLCAMHYSRLRNRGTTDDLPPKKCEVIGCENVYLAGGYCGKHYRQTDRYLAYQKAKRQEWKEKRQCGEIQVPSKKVCSTCKVEKSIDQFYDKAGTKTGKASRCNRCERYNLNATYKKYPERSKKACKDRYWRNPKAALERTKKWVENNKDRKREMDKNYNTKNKKKLQEQHHEYYLDNKEKIVQRSKDWSKLPKAKIARRKGHLRRRYNLAYADYESLLSEQNNACAICARSFDEITMSKRTPIGVDHDHKTGNVRGLLCARCNSGLSVVENTVFVEKALAYLKKAKKHEN